MGFAYEYTYQGHEYIIGTMNTKHARAPGGFLLQAAHKIALSRPKFICKYIWVCCKNFCDQVVQRIRL